MEAQNLKHCSTSETTVTGFKTCLCVTRLLKHRVSYSNNAQVGSSSLWLSSGTA